MRVIHSVESGTILPSKNGMYVVSLAQEYSRKIIQKSPLISRFTDWKHGGLESKLRNSYFISVRDPFELSTWCPINPLVRHDAHIIFAPSAGGGTVYGFGGMSYSNHSRHSFQVSLGLGNCRIRPNIFSAGRDTPSNLFSSCSAICSDIRNCIQTHLLG